METQVPQQPKTHSSSMVLSATVQSGTATSQAELDRALEAIKGKAQEFARLPLAEKRRLLAECRAGVRAVAAEWVAAACRAKGVDPGSPRAGEEWLAGPVITTRNLRLLEDSLAEIERQGKPRLGQRVHTRADGRVEIGVAPASIYDQALFAGFSAKVVLLPGWSESQARGQQASFYDRRNPAGGLALVLGAGNVASIPPTDAMYKMFVEGLVCIVKMNPVNEYLGPYFERALRPLIERHYLGITYGGGEVGSYLTYHPLVDDVHITGSDRTHDLIVWGPPGPERERRMRDKDPLLKKPITSELGNVSPVVLAPARFSDEELWFHARNVASMVTNNASFNCNAAKILVTSTRWPQREAFRRLVAKALGEVPTRRAYYPGAHERYQQLTAGRKADFIGQGGGDRLAWALIPEVDAKNAEDPLWRTEPFCGILTETALEAGDPAAFLGEAARFCNERLWGTLNAMMIVHPSIEKDPAGARAVTEAVDELRYGTVGINHWPAVSYALSSPPWGGHPSATLDNVQSGLGWVHNTFMLEGIEKAVLRGPFRAIPKPAWFYDHRNGHRVGAQLVDFEAAPGWGKVPRLALAGILG
ncbi:MAG TPA: aldehyde dehydrogenase [Polyangia bacterium]|nr:aldehyde dehydrogenase [Polyangia bacterium]